MARATLATPYADHLDVGRAPAIDNAWWKPASYQERRGARLTGRDGARRQPPAVRLRNECRHYALQDRNQHRRASQYGENPPRLGSYLLADVGDLLAKIHPYCGDLLAEIHRTATISACVRFSDSAT